MNAQRAIRKATPRALFLQSRIMHGVQCLRDVVFICLGGIKQSYGVTITNILFLLFFSSVLGKTYATWYRKLTPLRHFTLIRCVSSGQGAAQRDVNFFSNSNQETCVTRHTNVACSLNWTSRGAMSRDVNFWKNLEGQLTPRCRIKVSGDINFSDKLKKKALIDTLRRPQMTWHYRVKSWYHVIVLGLRTLILTLNLASKWTDGRPDGRTDGYILGISGFIINIPRIKISVAYRNRQIEAYNVVRLLQ